MPAAPLLTRLLTVAPQLKILVTSRSALHLRGEKLVEVPPLEMPDLDHLPPLETLTQISSVALFVERVRDVRGDFELTPENAPVAAAICARLDGLPLAIELAAAKTRILSLPALFSRMERQLALLTGGPRDAPLHQQTLRGSLESSYTLLGPDEQRLFRRLGIFAGSFTFEGAEGVAEATLDNLEAILDQSLLHLLRPPRTDEIEQDGEVTGGGEADARFAMLTPVREFAVEQLDAAQERADVALKHARYFLHLSLDAEPELNGPNQKLWLDRLDAVYNDIRAALDWSLKNEQSEIALRLAAAMLNFWVPKGYRQEGRRWLEQALAQGEDASATARIASLHALGILLHRQGERGEAERYLLEAVALGREVGERSLMIKSLPHLSRVLAEVGEYERATECVQESLEISRGLGDRFAVARALHGLASLAYRQDDFSQALIWYDEALAVRRQLGIPVEIAVNLQNLAVVALKQGDYQRAITYGEEGTAINAEVGNKEAMAYSLGVVGKAALKLGDYERAAANLTKTLSLFVELGGATGMVAFALEEIGRVAICTGEAAKAARLFGAAEHLREFSGAAISPNDRTEYDESVAAMRQALGEARFAAAWAVGRSMSLEEAVSYVSALFGDA